MLADDDEDYLDAVDDENEDCLDTDDDEDEIYLKKMMMKIP